MTHDEAVTCLNAAVAEVTEYAGTSQHVAALRMLDALAETYRHDLVSASPDQLVHRQACVRQVMALRDVFAGHVNADPRI